MAASMAQLEAMMVRATGGKVRRVTAADLPSGFDRYPMKVN